MRIWQHIAEIGQARVVEPGLWHYIYAEVNPRQKLFLTHRHMADYRERLLLQAQHANVEVGMILLFPTEIHLLLRPHDSDSLRAIFQPLHTAWARYVHFHWLQNGRVFRRRYHSCALQDPVDELARQELNGLLVLALRSELALAHLPECAAVGPHAESWLLALQAILGSGQTSSPAEAPRTWEPLPAEDCAAAAKPVSLAVLIRGSRPRGDPAWVRLLETKYRRTLRWRSPGRPRRAPPVVHKAGG